MSMMPPEPMALDQMLLLQGLTSDQRAMIGSHLHRRTVPAQTALMLMDDHGDVVYLIQSGTVKIYLDQADGTETILALLGPGELVGEMSLLERDSRSANVVTQEPCVLLSLDRSGFETLLGAIPQLALNLARLLARRLRLANAHIQALGTLDTYGRVAHQLLAFAREYGQPADDGGTIIPLRLTQSDMASLVGATRVRVNRVMVTYKRHGYIAIDARYYTTVYNAMALAQRCR